jgi:hypothetical protein
MPFIDDILKFSSLSIIGMEKNTGKTECLNYIINRIKEINSQHLYKNGHLCVAITSIGIDGENMDQVTKTHKPEIELEPGMLFVTSEKHYRSRKLISEVLALTERKTSLGRLVTAKVIHPGKVILSGPSTTPWMRSVITSLPNYGVNLTIVDGALSRKSSGSPVLTESLILTTGAAVSPHIPELVKKTKYIFQLINLQPFISESSFLVEELKEIDAGIYAIDKQNQLHNLSIPSSLMLEKNKEKLFQFGHTLFVAGAVGDNFLNLLKIQKEIKQTRVIVKDFTRIFASPEVYYSYLRAGGTIELLHKNQLIAICVNPTSPSGYTIDSKKLCNQLEQDLNVPIYDIRQIPKN